MIVRLAVPVFYKDTKYEKAEIVKPSGAVLADTKKSADTGDIFSALRVFLIGCVVSITTESGDEIDDKVSIKTLIGKMPYKTAEQLSFEIVKMYNGDDDGIEAVYYCPRCGSQTIAELVNNDDLEIDTRDHLSDLQIGYYDGDGFLSCCLNEPVQIKNAANNTVIEEIREFKMRFPTLEDGISAYQKYGMKDEVRLQFAMFVNALTEINGTPADNKWKNAVGMVFFEGIKDVRHDIGNITKEINSYGVIPEIDKICKQCGKHWKAVVNTSNFFGSALKPI